MKRLTLILLLVLSGVAGAQTLMETYPMPPTLSFFVAQTSPKITIPLPSDTHVYRNRQITIGDWEDWVKYCKTIKTDSTIIYYTCYGQPGSKCLPNCKHPKWIYSTKDPNDFAGFLQWLTKKYKE